MLMGRVRKYVLGYPWFIKHQTIATLKREPVFDVDLISISFAPPIGDPISVNTLDDYGVIASTGRCPFLPYLELCAMQDMAAQ